MDSGLQPIIFGERVNDPCGKSAFIDGEASFPLSNCGGDQDVSQEILFLTLDRIFKRGGRQMLTLRNTIWRDRMGSQIEFKKLLYSGFLCDKAAAQP
jgi:hypothetical protein